MGEAMHVLEWEYMEKSLYTPLNFSVNLKLLDFPHQVAKVETSASASVLPMNIQG